jgi:hypothetical protein
LQSPIQTTSVWTIDDEFDRIAREDIPGFGGFFFDENQNPVVYLVDLDERAAAETFVADVEARWALQHRDVIVRRADFDFTQLRQWRDRLGPLLTNDGVFTLDISESKNRVTVGVRDQRTAESVRDLATDLRIPAAAVVASIESPPAERQGVSVQDHQRPLRGGFQVQDHNPDWLCTLGINARYNGQRVFVTASHCSDVAHQLDGGSAYQQWVDDSRYIGYEIRDTDPIICAAPPWMYCRWSDASYYAVDDSVDYDFGRIGRTLGFFQLSPGSLIIHDARPTFLITRRIKKQDLYQGLWMNKVGRTSGWTRGPVTRTCITVWWEPFVKIRCNWEARLYSDSGDSGSPGFVAGGTGQTWHESQADAGIFGILHGGPEDDLTTTWFSPLEGVEQDLGDIEVCEGTGYGCVPPPPPPPIPPDSITISGPDEVKPDEFCRYFGSTSAGDPPYTFYWYKGLQYLGQGPEILVATGTSSFTLRLDVLAAGGRSGSKTMNVTVTSGAMPCFQ